MSDAKMGDSGAVPNVQYVTHPPPPYSMQPPPPGMHPGPPGMHPGQPVIMAVPANTVTTTLIMSSPAGPNPMIITCPSCNHQVVTRTEKNPSTKTHCIACILFWFICWPCVCLPYCMDSCNNIDHYCPNCNSYIGGYKY